MTKTARSSDGTLTDRAVQEFEMSIASEGPPVQHTPGPWRIVSGHVSKEGNWAADIEPEGRFRGFIASIQSSEHIPDGHSHEETQANARLIIAAPDLLEAVKALIPFATSNLVDWKTKELISPIGARRLAEAAIAKATSISDADAFSGEEDDYPTDAELLAAPVLPDPCPECGDKVHDLGAEWQCEGCGIVFDSAGPDVADARDLIAEGEVQS